MTALASAGTEVEVAVIGAGLAGLAAADHLRRAGVGVAVLEAGSRIGGRAFTDHPAGLGGARFDHGASWLHAAHRNPLIPLARAQGVATGPDTPWDERVRIMDPPGHTAPMAAYTDAEARWRACVTARLSGADCSLADAAGDMADDPWTATIETWEGAIIAAGDAADLSLHDWSANELDGENHVAPGGVGALVGRCFAHVPVRLGVRVTGLSAGKGCVKVRTDQGDLSAGAVILTVSTGVLRAESITFSPALPQPVLAALDGLPMGLLTKIVLRAAGENRLGLPAGTNIFRRVPSRGAPGLSTIFWPDGSDLAIGFLGGQAAWAFADRPLDAAAFMRAELQATFGADIGRAFGSPSLMTGWGTDPAFLGAYAYARPGGPGARAVLGAPLWDGRLALAGEACATDGLAGTVAGAYRSGEEAASGLLAGFTRARATV